MRARFCAASVAFLLCGMNANAAPFPAASPSSSTIAAANSAKKPYQESALGNCTTGTCQIQFPATTAKTTLIRHVSCGYLLTSGAGTVEVYLSGDGSNNVDFLPVSQYAPAANGSTVNVINEQTYYLLSAGKKPQIDVVTVGAGAQGLQCTVSGTTG